MLYVVRPQCQCLRKALECPGHTVSIRSHLVRQVKPFTRVTFGGVDGEVGSGFDSNIVGLVLCRSSIGRRENTLRK